MVARSAGTTGTPHLLRMAVLAAHTATTTPTATTEAALSPSTARVPGVGTVAATNPEVATASAECTVTPSILSMADQAVVTAMVRRIAHRVGALSQWTALVNSAPMAVAIDFLDLTAGGSP